MKRTPNGWDKRDYELWSAIRQLSSYGLIAKDSDNPMLSRKEVLALLESYAEERYANIHAVANAQAPDGEEEINGNG